MLEHALPLEKIVYVCFHRRDDEGARVCCSKQDGETLLVRLKEMIRDRRYRTKIRVSRSGCMDSCELGSNAMVFPDNVWLSNLKEEDLEPLVERLISDVDGI